MQNDNKINVSLLVWKVSIIGFSLSYFKWIFQNLSGRSNNVLICAADNVLVLIGLSLNLNHHQDLPPVISFSTAFFCSLHRHTVGNLENTNHQETKLWSYITQPQIKISTVHLYILCPHYLGCQTAFMVQKEAYIVCHLNESQAQEKFFWTQLLLFKIHSSFLPYWRGEWAGGYRGVSCPAKIPVPQSFHHIIITGNLGF